MIDDLIIKLFRSSVANDCGDEDGKHFQNAFHLSSLAMKGA